LIAAKDGYRLERWGEMDLKELEDIKMELKALSEGLKRTTHPDVRDVLIQAFKSRLLKICQEVMDD